MKRTALILGSISLAFLLTSNMVFAQQEQQTKEYEMKIIRDVRMSKPMMCPMCQMMQGMMGGGMMQRDMMGKGMRSDQDCVGLCKFGGPGFYEKHAEKLGLSDMQLADLKILWSDHKKKSIRKKADIKIAEIELSEILEQDAIDFGKAKSKITQIGSLKQNIRLNHLKTIETAQKILTAEQLTKFKTLKKKRCKKMMKSGMSTQPGMEKSMLEKGK